MKSPWGKWWAVVMAGLALTAGANEGWRFEVTPYAWLVGVDGRVTVGDRRADFDASFSDLVKRVDLAGSLMAIASHDRWVGFAQADFFSLREDFSKGLGGNWNSDMALVSAAAGYRFNGYVEGSAVDVLGGVRFLWDRSRVAVQGRGASESTAHLADAIVMLRPSLPLKFLSPRLRFNPTLSIGAGDSDLVWEVQPELQYNFTDRFAGRAGYRRVNYRFSRGAMDTSAGFQGFLIGFGVTL